MKKQKVEFILLDYEGECDFHPKSKFLGIKDGVKMTGWCLECLYKMLKEHNKGQWSVEKNEKKES